MRYFLILGVWVLFCISCAGVQDQSLPVMGLNTPAEKTPVEEQTREKPPAPQLPRKTQAEIDSSDALAQSLLFFPFKDLAKYTGPWDIHFELPRALADTLAGHEFLRVISVDSTSAYLKDKELQGKIDRDKALEIGRALGADYVVLGDIEELSMKRFRATVPIGGYRSYQGISTLALRPIKVIDGQPEEAVSAGAIKDSKKYGITNPVAYVPFEKEYYLLGEIEWGSEEFHGTLVGQAVGESLQKLATELSKAINPPPGFATSTPIIIDIVSVEEAYINVGSADGVENGDKFGVWDKGRELRDPQTDLYLGHSLPRRVGVVQVSQILTEHLSIVSILEGADAMEREFEVRGE